MTGMGAKLPIVRGPQESHWRSGWRQWNGIGGQLPVISGGWIASFSVAGSSSIRTLIRPEQCFRGQVALSDEIEGLIRLNPLQFEPLHQSQ